MYELAEIPLDPAGENLELLQDQKKVEELAVVRCPSCQGLRGMSKRNAPFATECHDCRHGNVIPRWTYCSFWVERFTQKEIEDMAKAIWG